MKGVGVVHRNVVAFFTRCRQFFSVQETLCRLFAAFCGSIVYGMVKCPVFYCPGQGCGVGLWTVAVCTVLLFAAYSLIRILLPSYETDRWLLMAGGTLCVMQWLLSFGGSLERFYFLMAVIVVYSLLWGWFIHNQPKGLREWKPRWRTVWGISILLGILCGSVIALTTCYRYLTFSSPNFDFGLFVNMFYHMKEEGVPLCTSERDVLLSHFAVHISPIYYVLLPFYAAFPSPMTLQIGQAVVIASGVVPMVLLCRRLGLSEKCTIGMAFLYACYPALTTGCHYDLHENCFLTPLLLWLFYSCECRKYWWTYLCALLVFMVKEDAAVYIAVFALYLIASGKNRKHGLVLFVLSVLYFGVALWMLQVRSAYYAQVYADGSPNPPIGGPMTDRYQNLILDPVDGIFGVVKTAVVDPGYVLTQMFGTNGNSGEKVVYFLQLLLPVGFLPLYTHKPSRWLLMTPILINLLTQYAYQYDIGFQYHFGIAAFLLYASALNANEQQPSLRRVMIGVAVANCLCFYLLYALSPCINYRNAWESGKDTYIQMENVLDAVPADASVCCSTFLVAHLADRYEVYEFEYHGIKNDTDYIVLDARQPIDDLVNDCMQAGYSIKERHKDLIVILEKNEKTAGTR